VALTDGTVRVVDVHDMELDAGPRSSCRKCTREAIPLLARHHPRLAVAFRDDDESGIVPSIDPVAASPEVFAQNRGFVLRRDGTTNTPELPGLDCVDCADVVSGGAGYVRVLPPPDEVLPDAGVTDDSDAGALADGGLRDGGVPAPGFERCPMDAPSIVCAISDPWFAIEEEWAITFAGGLPDSSHGDGRFVPPSDPDNRSGSIELVAPGGDFCSVGVEDGDQVEVVLFLVDESVVKVSPECEALLEDGKTEGIDPILIPIERVFANRLVLDEGNVVVGATAYPLSVMVDCTRGAPVAFHVRAGNDAYTVVGKRSGFLHPVTRNAAGRCVVDAEADPLRIGRAYANQLFQNGRIAFTPRAQFEGEPRPGVGAGVRFTIVSPASKVVFDALLPRAYVLPAQLRYSDLDRTLYLVDLHSRGLMPIPLDPIPDRPVASFQ
jgi:hypothetical protein